MFREWKQPLDIVVRDLEPDVILLDDLREEAPPIIRMAPIVEGKQRCHLDARLGESARVGDCVKRRIRGRWPMRANVEAQRRLTRLCGRDSGRADGSSVRCSELLDRDAAVSVNG